MNNSRSDSNDKNKERLNSNYGRERNQFNGFNSSRNGENKGSIAKESRPRAFNPVPYTKEESENIQMLLDKVLGPEYVSFRPGGGGQNVSYIEGWKALNLANEIFGFNGWSSELISSQVDYFDTHGNSGRYSMGLSVVVRITIKDGTYHEDFGYGYIDNAKSKAMAFEKCRKEAFTDGLKRCLRCFGNVLGNCLYDKTIISKIQKVKLPPVQLESDHFHRDPLLVKRENQKRNSTNVNILEGKSTNTASTNSAVSTSIATPIQDKVVDQSNQMQKDQSTPPQFVKPSNKTSDTSKNMEIVGDFDDSFVFSDDMPADAAMVNDGIDDYDMEMIMAEESSKNNRTEALKSEEPEPSSMKERQINSNFSGVMNAPAVFVSAKRADFLQETPEAASKVPQFDTKFISPSIRRTLDPNRSVPVKRSEVQSMVNGNNPSKLINKNSMINKPNTVPANSVGKRLVGLPPSQKPPIKRLHKE